MDRESSISSLKSSDSGYSSNSSRSNNSIKEDSLKKNQFFSDLIKNLWEDSTKWKDHLEQFKKEVAKYQNESNKKYFSNIDEERMINFAGGSEYRFSWKDVDSFVSKSEKWDSDQKKKIGASLLEMSKTKASLENGFMQEILTEFSEDYNYSGEIAEVYSSQDQFFNNLLHCIAGVISDKLNHYQEITEEHWEIYQVIFDDSKFWNLDLENQKNHWGRTPINILNTAGLVKGCEVYSLDPGL